MFLGLIEINFMLVISAVLSLIVMLLFWRIKKNSLQIAANSHGFKSLLHMPYRQMRKSIMARFGVYKLFLIILFLLFTALFFFLLHMKLGALAAGLLCLPCAALTALLFSELIWFVAYVIRKLLAIDNARMNTLFSINIIMLLLFFLTISVNTQMQRPLTFALAVYNLLFCYFITVVTLLLLLKEAGEKARALTFKNLWKSTILIILLFLTILAGLSYTGHLHANTAFAGAESYSYFDMFYYTCVTFATVGFGDIVPTNVFTRAVCILTIATSITCITIMLSTVLSVRRSEKE